MKKIHVKAYQKALIFKDDMLLQVADAGSYWLWNKTAFIYDMSQPFVPVLELNILLQNAELAAALEIVDVKDNEIALQFENGLFKKVLTAGRYAYWKGVIEYNFIKADISKVTITEAIDRSILQHALLSNFVRTVSIESHEKAVLFIDGKYEQVLNGGMYYWWKNNVPVTIAKIDTRQQQLEINGQEILTKDKAALRINAYGQYKVADIEQALLHNKEYDKQLYVAFQLALRELVGTLGFDELLEKKDSLAANILQQVQLAAASLGVEVVGFGIRDIILPGDVKEIMNQVLVAEKKAQANTIMRREETASTRSLLNTAKLMEENTMLWKLKEMEYVEKIAEKISNISVGGNGALVEQLKQIFVSAK